MCWKINVYVCVCMCVFESHSQSPSSVCLWNPFQFPHNTLTVTNSVQFTSKQRERNSKNPLWVCWPLNPPKPGNHTRQIVSLITVQHKIPLSVRQNGGLTSTMDSNAHFITWFSAEGKLAILLHSSTPVALTLEVSFKLHRCLESLRWDYWPLVGVNCWKHERTMTGGIAVVLTAGCYKIYCIYLTNPRRKDVWLLLSTFLKLWEFSVRQIRQWNQIAYLSIQCYLFHVV